MGKIIELKCHDNVFDIDKIGIASTIKVRVIQAMIQIERPIGWGFEKIKNLALEIRNIEMYNLAVKKRLLITKNKWHNIR